jgi:uncharacterized hydrophobic protein (TIGR00271 family)
LPTIFTPVSEDYELEVIRSLDESGALSNDYVVLNVLSCAIATFGLILNSAAVIIGAMLVAPLMGPILRLGLALVTADLDRSLRALRTLLVGVVIAIGLSALFGNMVSIGPLNFLEELPSEVTSRTRPNLFDLIVALAGGTVAAYATSQPKLSSTIAGVAIATALMPPLCTSGIGLSQGDLDVSGGALLLFTVNLVSIVFAGSTMFALVGFRPINAIARPYTLPQTLLFSGTLVLIVGSALVGTTIGIIRETRETRQIRTILSEQLEDIRGSELVGFERLNQLGSDETEIVVHINAENEPTWREARDMQDALGTALQRPVKLRLLVVPITSLEAVEPPTLTPTPPPEATATPSPSVTPRPSATPTARPSRTPMRQVTAMTPSASPSRTPRPSATPAPRPTATPPPPTATPIAYAVVSVPGGTGINLRRTPAGDVITLLPDGLLVQLTGRSAQADNLTWLELITPSGQVGWSADVFLAPYQRFEPPR